MSASSATGPLTGGGSSSVPATAAKYDGRENAGAVVDIYSGSDAAAAAAGAASAAFARPSFAALKSYGFRAQRAVARLQALGAGPLPPLDAAAWPKPSAGDPLPLVCASVTKWCEVTGMRRGEAPPRLADGSGNAATAGVPGQLQLASPTSTSPQQSSPTQAALTPAAASPAAPATTSLDGAANSTPVDGAGAVSAATGDGAQMHTLEGFALPADRNVAVPYRFMFTTLEERAAALEGRLEEAGDAIVDAAGLGPLVVPVGTTSQVPIVYVGRIVVDGEGRLNASSVLLEGSNAAGGSSSSSGGGRYGAGRVLLDLREAVSAGSDGAAPSPWGDAGAGFSLFPGQVVAVRGINTGGDIFIVSHIYHGLPLPTAADTFVNATALAECTAATGGGPLRVWAAAGPFTLSTNLEYVPLQVSQRAATAIAVSSRVRCFSCARCTSPT